MPAPDRPPERTPSAPPPDEDRAARFTALFEATHRPLLAYAVRRVADPSDAADVVAEAFLVAWRRLDDAPASRLEVDLGAGLRINSPNADGQIRLDLAVGARDGRLRASAGYLTRWGEGGW